MLRKMIVQALVAAFLIGVGAAAYAEMAGGGTEFNREQEHDHDDD